MKPTERWGMVIDLNRCIGCHGCAVGCKVHNNVPLGHYWSRVLRGGHEGEYPHARIINIPRMCMQCQDAPCVKVCPAKATEKLSNGIVIVDEKKCVGCKYCIMACPYGARIFDPTKKVVQKCNFCLERLEAGQQPVCVETCIGQARYFGDLNDPHSEVRQKIGQRQGFTLLEHLGTNPAVYYLPVR